MFDAMAAVVEAENEQCLATADGLRQEMVAEAVALRTALAQAAKDGVDTSIKALEALKEKSIAML